MMKGSFRAEEVRAPSAWVKEQQLYLVSISASSHADKDD